MKSKGLFPLQGTPSTETAPFSAQELGAQVSKNAGAILIGRGVAIGFSTAAAILLARYLGSEKLGQFASIYAYLALFGWIATFGFEPILVREISRDRINASSLIHTAVVLSCYLACGSMLVGLLLAPLAGYIGVYRNLLALAALEFVFIPIRLPGVIFQVDMRQWYGSAINMARQALWLGIVVLLWFLGGSLAYVILGRVICAFTESALLWVCARNSLKPNREFLSAKIRVLLFQSFPLAFTSFVATIYLRIDQVMLHKMASDAVLGQYAAAVKVSELFELFPAALMSSLAPVLSVLVSRPVEFRKYIATSFRYFMVLGAALCVFLSVGSKAVVGVFYGSQFLPAAPILTVLIWSEIAVFFATVVLNAMIAQNLQKLLPWPTVVGAAINVGLNIFLIPKYSALGAAWATLVSYTVAWMLFLLVFSKTRPLILQGLRFAIPAVFVGSISVLAVHFFSGPGWLGFVYAGLIFTCGLALTRMIRLKDFSLANELLLRALRTMKVI